METSLSHFQFAQFQFFIKPTGSINLAAYRYVDWQTQGEALGVRVEKGKIVVV
jgi:hypothetical protein